MARNAGESVLLDTGDGPLVERRHVAVEIDHDGGLPAPRQAHRLDRADARGADHDLVAGDQAAGVVNSSLTV